MTTKTKTRELAAINNIGIVESERCYSGSTQYDIVAEWYDSNVSLECFSDYNEAVQFVKGFRGDCGDPLSYGYHCGLTFRQEVNTDINELNATYYKKIDLKEEYPNIIM